ncbi:hypothetical protein ILUMI_02368 [Ignelater luminosus]|uniref:Death domain-containing protein n=1 Tax=Ignelater luminosus TaxID=2038154 RepID=A0A8K0DIA5_IGNLU|nr:hypothetical protein ILUMI_02368 [Ignelater luminosus]
MAIDTNTYNHIKSEVTQRCKMCSGENFIVLKQQFRDDINSARRLDNIRNVQDLIQVLEKRNVVSQHNINVFIKIATTTQQPGLLLWINTQIDLSKRDTSSQTAPNSNYNNAGDNNQPVLNLQHRSRRNQIFDCIVEQIGYKWKDLARNLDIVEGRIDELEERYKTIAERTRQILLYHETLYPETWLPLLLEALNRSRRNDLRLIIVQRFYV